MPSTAQLKPDDLCALPVVTFGGLDAVHQFVAYTVSWADKETNSYRGSIRAVRIADGSTRAYTHGRYRDFSPQWSPSGERLFFLSDRGGSVQIWSIEVDGGEARALPQLPGSVSEFALSPDGKHVAAIATPDTTKQAIEERGWRRVTRLRYRADGVGYLDDPACLWLIELASGNTRELDGGGFDAAPAWSPDGARLAFVGEHNPNADMLWHHELWVAEAATGFKPEQMLQLDGALEVPAWSPDSGSIAFIGLQSATGSAGITNMRLFSTTVGGGGVHCWTPQTEWTACNAVLTDTGAAGNIPPPVWLDSHSIAVLGTQHGCARIFMVRREGAARALTPPTHSGVQFAAFDATAGVLTAADAVSPPELYAWHDGEALRPLTQEARPWANAAGLRAPMRFHATGPGGDIDAWYLPGSATAARRPAVLQIHGGPHFCYGEAFFFEFQLLAACGFDVVYCNPRGSQSYGEAFAGAIIGDWATPAFLDCMAVMDKALELYPLDERRLAVAGGSYGGYLTAWTIAHTARFAAAIAMRPATNLASLWGTSEVGRMLNDELGGSPTEMPEVYRRCSPLTYVDAISTPLLITQAESDYRCPPEQAEQLFAALRVRGQTVELLRFLNADHGMSRTGAPRSRVARLEAITQWLERYLLRSQTAETAAST